MVARKKTVRTSRKSPSASIPGVKPGHVLVLRTCAADMTAHGGFKWPTKGLVKCPDWDPTPNCGNGLHGALWGEGCGDLLSFAEDAKWLVVEVKASDVVDLQGKVKFPRGRVVYCGTRLGATAYICERRPGAVIGGTATAGNYGTATAGYRGTATAGNYGTATAGYGGTIVLRYYDRAADRYRLVVGYVGENGILPNVKYKVENGALVKA